MGSLYRQDLNKYKNYFKEAAKLLGIDVDYRYLIKRNTEEQSGESIYSNYSEPIKQSVIIEQGAPMVESLKQLGWFSDTETSQILVDFAVDTPNLQEGCRFRIKSNENDEQGLEYIILKMSNTMLYPDCIKCLCQPILQNESEYHNPDGTITYGQQEIIADDENYNFINEKPKITIF